MRHVIPLALLLATAAACSDPPAPPPEPRDRPLARDGSLAREITSTPDRARVQLDLATVRGALQLHRGERGGWPATLDELPVQGLHYPADLDYDPSTGRVTSRTYPGL